MGTTRRQSFTESIGSNWQLPLGVRLQMKGLKQKAIRGGFAKLFGQALNFVLRILFLVIMARLLDPEDFGLVAMVTVIAGLFGLVGLSSASIQKDTITDEQISTLFWINMLIGGAPCVSMHARCAPPSLVL